MESWIDEIPPTDQPQRFGNKAYRTWFEKLEQVRDQVNMFTPQLPLVTCRTKRNPYLFDSPPTFCIYLATLNVKMASVSQNWVVMNFDSIISDITVDGRANVL